MKVQMKIISRVMNILTGSLIAAIAINEYIIPHHLLSGGVGGIAIIVHYTTGISTGVLVFAMNIPIFIEGIRKIDRDFIIYSFVGTFGLSIFLIVLNYVRFLEFLRVDDIMLAAIFGGVINGIGAGLIFKNRGSMGGTDIIAVIVKRKRSINIGTVLFSINIFIICIASSLYGIKPALYTLISMYISAAVIDRVQEGFDRKKSVFIVSEKDEEIVEAILKKVHRGVTYLYGEGAYTKKERRIIYCIVTLKQLSELKHLVKQLDPSAFFTITDTSEVSGKGFIYRDI
ncbi:MAG: YitT family protein [Clostridiales bacterium]|nr:YitT family protein [Clostridiales bacterium]HBM79664.1 YitT family protein [Clostridiaceae bacterium]